MQEHLHRLLGVNLRRALRPVLGSITLPALLLSASCSLDTTAPCDADTQNCEIEQASQSVVYGTDTRKEYADPSVAASHKTLADSVALIFTDPDAQGNAASCNAQSCVLLQSSVAERTSAGNLVFGMCEGERFGPSAVLPDGQPRAARGRCTSFLVGPDLMATAAHCFRPDSNTFWTTEAEACSHTKVVFDYHADEFGDAPLLVDATDVYSCRSVVTSVKDPNVDDAVPNGKDYALFRLDRPVTGRKPVPIRRTGQVAPFAPLLLAGHPSSLPLKLDAGGRVERNLDSNIFTASIDAFGGNSGSPVFNRETGLVEGILESGNDDYKISFPANDPDGCLRPTICPSTGCTGADMGNYAHESVNRVSQLAALIPDQSPRRFAGASLTLDTTYARVATGDFDGDGRGDVLFQGADGASDRIWYGKFDKSYDSVAITVPDGYGVPLVGDFDGDGRSDVFWYRSGTGQDRIWWGQPTRSNFGTAANTTSMREDGAGYSPFVGDFDGNRGADIFWYGRGASAPGEKIWWSNRNRNGQPTNGSTPTFTSQTQTINGTSYYPVTGDFNADGKADIFWFQPGSTGGSMWRHTTGRSFASTNQSVPSTIGTSHRPYAADYDGNGAVDILFYASGAISDYVWWFRIDSKGQYRSTTLTVSGSYKPAVGDFNGDTAADILWYGTGTSTDSRSWGRLL